MVDKKIMADCEKFLQYYNERCLEIEARRNFLEKRDHELKKKEEKLLKDGEKLELKKKVRERLLSCKQLVNESYSLRKLAECQKKELNILHKRITKLENQLKAKSFKSLQSEIMNLETALQAIEENDGIDLEEKLKNLQRKVVEKDEQIQESKNMSKALNLRIDKNNLELQEARRELIDGLEMHPFSGDINIKTMGMLDSMPFFVGPFSTKKAKINATKFKLVCRHLKNPDWHPFTIGSDKKEIIDEKDEKMVSLKAECSEEQYRAIVRALNEINEYDTSGKDHVQELWNFKEQRKASLKEGICYILKELA